MNEIRDLTPYRQMDNAARSNMIEWAIPTEKLWNYYTSRSSFENDVSMVCSKHRLNSMIKWDEDNITIVNFFPNEQLAGQRKVGIK